MTKRVIALILAVVTATMFLLPGTASVSAESYPNTHTNTGDQRYDIVQIALTQLGYTESDTDRKGSNGYTKYGDFYGYPYADWCGCFVNWCARKANVSTSVLARTGLTRPSNWGLTAFRSSERIPQAGDIFFKCWESGSYAGHVGIVYKVDVANNICYTIEGNTGARASDGQAYIVKIVERTLSQHAYGSPNYSGSSNNSNHTHKYSDHFEDAHPHKTYKQCDTCGYVTYDGNKKTIDSCSTCVQENCSHSYGSWETTGDGQHKRVCTNCKKTETGSHSWQDHQLIKEANCKEAGSKTQKCGTCGAERTRTIEKTADHTYSEWEYVNDEIHKRTCSFCGFAETVEHDLGEEITWSTDEAQHWQACAVCEQKVLCSDHKFGTDCVSPCEVCQFVRADGHDYSETFSYNSTEHWYECVACDDKGSAKEHTYSAVCDEDCDDCGYVREVKHSYGDDMITDTTGHWYECDVCGKQNGFSGHKPGPMATEEAAQLCTVCDFEIAPKIDHVHKFEPFQTNTMTHWGKCRCGMEYAPEAHIWDVNTGNCATCGVASIVETDNTNWDIVWVAAGLVLLSTVAASVGVMASNRKKRKDLEADPYWA